MMEHWKNKRNNWKFKVGRHKVHVGKNHTLHRGYYFFKWRLRKEKVNRETVMWTQTGFSIRWGWWSLWVYNGVRVPKERWTNA